MAKRKYLALTAFFLPQFVLASPWLAEEGEYTFITSAYITDKTSEKRLSEESRARAITFSDAKQQ